MLIVHDPPFLEETRRHKAAYGIEPGKLADCDEDWHREAADLLNRHQGPAVVLGRPTALYEEIFENVGWERIDRTYQANSGSKQTESIWINPVLVGRQSVNFGLFAGVSS